MQSVYLIKYSEAAAMFIIKYYACMQRIVDDSSYLNIPEEQLAKQQRVSFSFSLNFCISSPTVQCPTVQCPTVQCPIVQCPTAQCPVHVLYYAGFNAQKLHFLGRAGCHDVACGERTCHLIGWKHPMPSLVGKSQRKASKSFLLRLSSSQVNIFRS